jgi:hypothetical protein
VGAPPFFAGLADAGGKAAERFRALGERYEGWKMYERLIDGVLKAPMRGERPYAAFLKLMESKRDLTLPLVELRKALACVKGETEKDTATVTALVLYKTLAKNDEAYGELAELYKWARSLVERQEFTVTAEEVARLREVQKRLGGGGGGCEEGAERCVDVVRVARPRPIRKAQTPPGGGRKEGGGVGGGKARRVEQVLRRRYGD